MARSRSLSPRFLIFLPLLAVLLIGLACGGTEETPAPQPTPTLAPTPTPVDVAAIASGLQEVIKGTVEEAMKEQQPAAESPISQEDLRRLVEQAIAATAPEEASPEDIRNMVAAAVAAAAQPGVTKEEVSELVARAVAESAGEALTAAEVQEIVAMAVATPTPLPTAVPSFMWMAPDWVSQGKQGGVIPMSTLGGRDEWDPHQGSGTLSYTHSSPLFSHLVRFNPVKPDEIAGDLARSWTLSDDGSSYTFVLWDAQWTDGEPVTAEDIKFSLDRMVEEGQPRPKAKRIAPYYAGSEVIDNRTVRVDLKIAGSPAFLQYLGVDSMKIMPKHIGDMFDLSTPEGKEELNLHFKSRDNIVGSGPFRLVEYVPETEYEHERNPNYFKDGLPFLDGMKVFFITDANRLTAAYRAEQVLMPNFGDIGLSVRDLEQMERDLAGQIVLHWVPPHGFDGTFVNPERPPFDNAKVRKAIYLAIDRLDYIDTLLAGRGTMGTPFPPRTWMTPSDEVVAKWPGFRYVDIHTGEPVLNYYGRDDVEKDPLDMVKARALLEEEGYTAENPLEWTYTAFNLQYHKSVALLLKEQWEKLDNVKVEIKLVDIPTGFSELREGKYDMGMVTAPIAISDSDDVFQSFYKDACATYRTCFSPTRMQELFDLSSKEPSQSRRQELVREAGEIIRQGEGYWRGIAWIERFSSPVNVKVKNYHVPLTLDYGTQYEQIWLEDPSEFN